MSLPYYCTLSVIHAQTLTIRSPSQAEGPDSVEASDVLIFSHGHFSRVFIARWCGFPLQAGYNFASDAGGVSGLWPMLL